MKIAIVNQPLDGILPPDQNSIGIWTYEVARRLSSDHAITVFGRAMGYLERAGIRRRTTDQGVDYRFGFAAPAGVWSRLSSLWERLPFTRQPFYASPLYYLEYSLPIALRIRRERPDIVHIHNFTGFVPVVRALNPDVEIVLHMNCEWLSQLDERTMAKRIGAVDAVFGSSGYITDLVRRRFPQFADRCHTVYNGVDPDAFDVDPNQLPERDDAGPMLAFVGRVSPEKGVHDLLDAMATVVAEVPGTHLEIIGPVGALPKSYIVDVSDDPMVADLARFYERDYGETLGERVADGLEGAVTFTGPMAHDDVVRHVAGADVLVNPSYSESFGMSLVEAMACQTPVVATRVGGMQEIVTDETGVLVDRDDAPGLASALVRLLADAQLRQSMGVAGRRRVQDVFAWDRVAEAAVGVYTQIAPATDPP